ncbi:MAG TPA: hypothetical protein V6D17_05395 [Candidatus Obscuribacterales bacterium]
MFVIEVAYDQMRRMLEERGYEPTFAPAKNLALALDDLACIKEMLIKEGFASQGTVAVSASVAGVLAELVKLRQELAQFRRDSESERKD